MALVAEYVGALLSGIEVFLGSGALVLVPAAALAWKPSVGGGDDYPGAAGSRPSPVVRSFLFALGFAAVCFFRGQPLSTMLGKVVFDLQNPLKYGAGAILAWQGLTMVGMGSKEAGSRLLTPAWAALTGASLGLAFRPGLNEVLVSLEVLMGMSVGLEKGGRLLLFHCLGVFQAVWAFRLGIEAIMVLGGPRTGRGAMSTRFAGLVVGLTGFLFISGTWETLADWLN
ncbi:MAG: hypothetical protein V1816_09300 [Pseudomonadota bacterium]